MLEGYIDGEVFARFDRQDSGNISYGVRSGELRYFVKTAGASGSAELLRNAAVLAQSCSHPLLVPLRRVIESPHGPLLVYDWFDGELLDRRAEASQRFRALPSLPRWLTAIFDLHVVLADAGWIANDFYDGCLMYDFQANELRVIDLDLYRRGPFRNEMGRLFGSTRFMAPEEFELGALIDERTTVFNMGRAAFVFLGEPDGFRGSPAQLAAARIACQADPARRFASLRAFRDAWG
jgi:serine/threonine-protein kinase